jgi:hypothetical protein
MGQEGKLYASLLSTTTHKPYSHGPAVVWTGRPTFAARDRLSFRLKGGICFLPASDPLHADSRFLAASPLRNDKDIQGATEFQLSVS